MARTQPGTLTADEAVWVEVDGHNQSIEVVNRAQAGEIWARVDGTGATVAGAGCYLILGARRIPVDVADDAAARVSLISSQSLAYTVEAGG